LPEPLRLKKKLSQNFLPDPGTLNRIVGAAGVGPEDEVLEIGAGSGHLTAVLASKASRVTCIEMDRRLEPILAQRFSDKKNVGIVFADALKTDLDSLTTHPPVKVVANLPYHVATPVLLRLLKHSRLWSGATLLLQKEMVVRICAATGRQAGSISHLVRLYAEPSNKGTVKRTVFTPRPKVDSAILHLDFTKPSTVQPADPDNFEKLIRAAFSGRRKMLVNSLGQLGTDKAGLIAALAACGIDAKARPEDLGLAEFVSLSDRIP